MKRRIFGIMEEVAASATTTTSIDTTVTPRATADGTAMGYPYFKACNDTFHKALCGKKKHKHFKKFLNNESDLSNRVRCYIKANPKQSLLLQNDRTGEFVFLRKAGN